MLAVALLLSLQDEPFTPADFEKHIRFLASPEMKGRDLGMAEGKKAAQYVADRFKELGLKPAGRDGYFQDFTSRGLEGRNVAGRLEGETADVVIVAAHHDARGVIDGKVQAGADDNASGVAMVLELARSFKGAKLRRSLLFVSFDGEEKGLVGSREFVKSEIVDPKSIAAMIVFDLVGGDFMEWEKSRLYALGSEYSAELSDRVSKDAAETRDLDVVRGSVALIEPYPDMARSDYHAFRARNVPFVFFSTGTPWYYHTEHDTIERINFAKMTKAARFIRRVIAETAADEKRPVFRPPAPVEEDAKTISGSIAKVLEHRGALKLTDKQVDSLRSIASQIAESKEPDFKTLQQAMMLIFTIARSQGKP